MLSPTPPDRGARHARAALLATLLVAGCADIEVADDLPAAPLLAPYEATLSITGARGEAHVDLFDGTLPDGLALDGDGRLHGEPLGLGLYEFSVRVVDSVNRYALASLTLEVTATAEQVYLGPVLTEADMNLLCLDGVDVPDHGWAHFMCLPWVRIAGGGMAGQDTRTIRAGMLWVGPDGTADGGWGDDVLLQALPAEALAWGFEAGSFLPQYPDDGANSPADTTVDDGGTLIAGERTGPGQVIVAHPTHGAGAIDVLVVPPDFCPAPQGC